MFAKFLLTVAVVALIWFGFRFAQRVLDAKIRPDRPSGRGGAARFTPDPDGESVRDLVKCATCDTWRPSTSGACGRPHCPH